MQTNFEKSQASKIASFYTNSDELEIKSAEDFLNSEITKGGKKAVLGEKRTFGGREYIKTLDGWKFHGKGTGAKAQSHAAAHSKDEEFGDLSRISTERLQERLEKIEASVEKNRQAIRDGGDKLYYSERALHLNSLADKIDKELEKREVSHSKETSIKDKNEAIHDSETVKKLAEFSGLSVKEFETLHPDTKIDFLAQYNKEKEQFSDIKAGNLTIEDAVEACMENIGGGNFSSSTNYINLNTAIPKLFKKYATDLDDDDIAKIKKIIKPKLEAKYDNRYKFI